MKEKGLEFIKMLDSIANLKHDYLVKNDDDTDERYGYIPYERPTDLYIRSGLVVLDKPPGPTSHEVVAWIKKMFGLSKAGHGGTLELSPLVGWAGKPQSNWSTPHSTREGYEGHRHSYAFLQRVRRALWRFTSLSTRRRSSRP